MAGEFTLEILSRRASGDDERKMLCELPSRMQILTISIVINTLTLRGERLA